MIHQCVEGDQQKGQTVHMEYAGKPVQLSINKIDIHLLQKR